MPIRADLLHFYGREWRLVVRPRILARAENRCEHCGVPNGAQVKRVGGFWLEEGASSALGVFRRWRTSEGGDWRELGDPPGRVRVVQTQLGVAHLNHKAGDDRDENLKALCRWCHLHHDFAHHAETRAIRKDAARPLLSMQEAAVRGLTPEEWASQFEELPRFKEFLRRGRRTQAAMDEFIRKAGGG